MVGGPTRKHASEQDESALVGFVNQFCKSLQSIKPVSDFGEGNRQKQDFQDLKDWQDWMNVILKIRQIR